MQRTSLVLVLMLAFPVFAQEPGTDGSSTPDTRVEDRGIKDALNRRKAKQLEKTIQKTEAKQQATGQRLAAVRAKLASYENAQPVDAQTVDLAGVRFKLARVRVDGQVMGEATARREGTRLRKRQARLQREIDDYTAKLDGGPLAYGENGPPRRGLRGKLEDVQEEIDGPFLQRVNRRPDELGLADQPPQVGALVGGHRVRKRLGGGANGEVFLAEGEGGQLSVIKHAAVRDPAPGSEAEFQLDNLRRVRRMVGIDSDLSPEELVRANTNHEVRMQNLAAESGSPMFIRARVLGGNRIEMPYAGVTAKEVMRTLTLRLQRGELGPDVYRAAVQKLTRQMLEATAQLDDSGIVHRDIKLENMALARDGSLRVIDFGSAKPKGENDYNFAIRTGVGVMGWRTDLLAAPEAVQADDLSSITRRNIDDPRYVTSHRTDVYSVGKAAELVELTNGADAATTSAIRTALRRGDGGASISEALAQDAVDARPTAKEALRRRSLWERFPRATEDAAGEALRQASGQLIDAQTRVAPPRPAAGPPPVPPANP